MRFVRRSRALHPQAPTGARRPTGISVAGEVAGFRPVTDAMLRRPPADDWLMIRGNYQAWNYSELNQITPDNVDDLRWSGSGR